ncbi:MAG TPA: ECF transporter S component [Anaerolineales bacterium]|nr:ECF transporter S component [Anaerolineales bacterium]
MDKKFWNVLISLIVVLAIFVVAALVLSTSFDIRFVFVGLALIIAFVVYYVNKDNKAWEVGTRQVVWMAIGAALYAIFSWLFNGTVFVVPSLSQVALRPAIAIPMFFGYAFGPVVGFFSGAIGNVFGDAISGFGLSPQWSIGNGLIGFVAGLWMLFSDKKRSVDTVMWVSGVLALLGVLLFFFNRNVQNQFYFAETQPVSLLAGISILIGFVLVLIVRFVFGSNIDIAAAVTWGMLGNIVGILFASLSDIWVNGYSLTAAVVGEFLPAAGPNLIFAAILVPLLVVAYASVQRQSGR